MDFRQIFDDFFTIGNITILQRKTGNASYDFDFRNHFECMSVISGTGAPILLHIGAVEDYGAVERALNEMGMRLLISEGEHLRCSTIEKWYPCLKNHTPFTIVYDELPEAEELHKDFSFPVFIKGNRQTSRHRRSQCIIENAGQYEALRKEWKRDPILSWQKAAVREYVPLQTVDAETFPDMVPVSYEFRFFFYEGKCMAHGPYWTMGKQYSLAQYDLEEAMKLAEWAAFRLGVSFCAIDIAKTAAGEWIIIEVNDAQESGFVGVNPLTLWNNTVEAMQKQTWFPMEEFFGEDAVILGGDPLPHMTVEEMWETARHYATTEELVRIYVDVSNKFWWHVGDEDCCERGSEEYNAIVAAIEAWSRLLEYLEGKAIACAKEEGLFREEPDLSFIKQIEPFLEKHGYHYGSGWWVANEE